MGNPVNNKILIIDDSLIVHHQITRILEKENYQCISASNGSEGVMLAGKHNPACIFLDITMPGMSGYDVLIAFKEKEITIPVIVLTADVQDMAHEICRSLGAVRVVKKPLTKKTLCQIVNQIIQNP